MGISGMGDRSSWGMGQNNGGGLAPYCGVAGLLAGPPVDFFFVFCNRCPNIYRIPVRRREGLCSARCPRPPLGALAPLLLMRGRGGVAAGGSCILRAGVLKVSVAFSTSTSFALGGV